MRRANPVECAPLVSSPRPLPTKVDDASVEVLVRRVQGGDAEATAQLVRMFLRAAHLCALSIVTRPSDAEDVAQDAFVSALEHIHSCREPARFAGWFLQIVRNRALNWLARRKHRDVAVNDDDRPAAATSGEPTPGSPRLKQQLLSALKELTETQREIVLLHDLEEWTHGEIAAALGMSEVMCRQHLWNARRKLRVQLSAYAPAEKK